jgi:hypothetical protein
LFRPYKNAPLSLQQQQYLKRPRAENNVFCSILIRNGQASASSPGEQDSAAKEKEKEKEKELCLDIAGESSAHGAPLLGYECTGRWNQMFKLGDNCTIIAEQPAVVSRVRGQGDQALRSCLEVSERQEGKENDQYAGVLRTAKCVHLEKPVPVAPSSLSAAANTTGVGSTAAALSQGGVGVGVGAGVHVGVGSTDGAGVAEGVVVAQTGEGVPVGATLSPADGNSGAGSADIGPPYKYLRKQQFEFLLSSGEVYKMYLK